MWLHHAKHPTAGQNPQELRATCRGKIERNITLIAQNVRQKEDVLQEAIQHFRAEFQAALRQQGNTPACRSDMRLKSEAAKRVARA